MDRRCWLRDSLSMVMGIITTKLIGCGAGGDYVDNSSQVNPSPPSPVVPSDAFSYTIQQPGTILATIPPELTLKTLYYPDFQDYLAIQVGNLSGNLVFEINQTKIDGGQDSITHTNVQLNDNITWRCLK